MTNMNAGGRAVDPATLPRSDTAARSTVGPIGVGIIGLSADAGWAATAHVPALAALPELFRIRALSASSPESATRAGEKYRIPLAFGDPQQLVERDEVDLVVVSVKVPDHRELVLSALAAGKHVLSEWPLGTTTDQAVEMADAARERGVRGFVGLQARLAPPVRHLRDLVAGGYVGEVLSTSVIASGPHWGATYDDRGAYLFDRANGATMTSIPLGHTLDGIASVLGRFVELDATVASRRTDVHHERTGVPAPRDVDDQVAVTATLDTGAVASVHYRGGVSRATNFLWEINGTDGDLLATGNSGHLQFGQFALRGGRGTDVGLTELTVPDDYDTDVPALATGRHTMAYTVAHAYAHIHRDLTSDTRTVPDFDHAVRHHRLLDHLHHAATTGRRTTVTD